MTFQTSSADRHLLKKTGQIKMVNLWPPFCNNQLTGRIKMFILSADLSKQYRRGPKLGITISTDNKDHRIK